MEPLIDYVVVQPLGTMRLSLPAGHTSSGTRRGTRSVLITLGSAVIEILRTMSAGPVVMNLARIDIYQRHVGARLPVRPQRHLTPHRQC